MTVPEFSASDPARLLTSAWTELLGVTTVSADDNFIEMGGNSLVATILSTRIEEESGVALDIQDIFQLSFAQLVDRLRA